MCNEKFPKALFRVCIDFETMHEGLLVLAVTLTTFAKAVRDCYDGRQSCNNSTCLQCRSITHVTTVRIWNDVELTMGANGASGTDVRLYEKSKKTLNYRMMMLRRPKWYETIIACTLCDVSKITMTGNSAKSINHWVPTSSMNSLGLVLIRYTQAWTISNDKGRRRVWQAQNS